MERNMSCTRSIKPINIAAVLKHSCEVQVSVGEKALKTLGWIFFPLQYFVWEIHT